MENTLQELDIHLKRIRPDFYNSLQDSLGENAINKLEEKYNIQIPQDFKTAQRLL